MHRDRMLIRNFKRRIKFETKKVIYHKKTKIKQGEVIKLGKDRLLMKIKESSKMITKTKAIKNMNK